MPKRRVRTAAQIAASRRNLEKARAARQYDHLAPGTYIIGNDGVTKRVVSKPTSKPSVKFIKPKSVKKSPSKALVGNVIHKKLSGSNIKFHPYTGKPYDLNDTGGKEIPLIGLRGANKWLRENTSQPKKPRRRRTRRK